MTDISVIILTKDEHLHIRRCLEKLRPLDPCQVFVVDCFSADDTREIAEEMGAVVVQHEWPGSQAVQFNWALGNLPIEGKWILRIDADEYLLEEAISSIRSRLESLPEEVCGVVCKRRTIFCGKWVKRGTYPVKLLRLFRTGTGVSEERRMDEHIRLLRGTEVEFDGDLVDHNLNDIDSWKEKHRGYAKREAMDAIDIMNGIGVDASKLDGQAAAKRAQKIRYYKLPPYLRAFIYFAYRYFLKGGIFEGRAGFMWNFWQGLWYRCLVDKEIMKLKKRR